MTNSLKLMTRGLAALATLAAATSAVHGDIIDLTGSIELLDLPSTLEAHQFESSSSMAAFNEGARYLQQGVWADITLPGLYSGSEALSSGFVGEGELIESHLLHVDPVNDELIFNDGTITFDHQIIGIILLTESLRNSDPLAGATHVSYDTQNTWRGVELGDVSPLDWISLSENGRSITIHTGTDSALDEIRVLTQVPAPGSAAMMIIGALSLNRRHRRRRD